MSTMSTTDDDVEHWPADDKHYESSNRPSPHTCHPPTAATPSSAVMPLPSPLSQVVYAPVFDAHHQQKQAMTCPQQPQYYSHPPQPAIYMGYPPQHGYYYTYAAAPPSQPQVVAASAPAPVPATTAQPSGGANFHVYHPAYSDPKSIPKGETAPMPGPPGNMWLGRTKAQVEEDNMKIAKREGAYNKHKIAPVDAKDDQIFWVVELDGSHSLRDFRYIKQLNGTWKQDPRFEDSYYFVREEEEEERK